MSAHERAIEAKEIVGILKKSKFAAVLQAIEKHDDCRKKNGKLNVDAIARHLKQRAPNVQRLIGEMRATRLY